MTQKAKSAIPARLRGYNSRGHCDFMRFVGGRRPLHVSRARTQRDASGPLLLDIARPGHRDEIAPFHPPVAGIRQTHPANGLPLPHLMPAQPETPSAAFAVLPASLDSLAVIDRSMGAFPYMYVRSASRPVEFEA